MSKIKSKECFDVVIIGAGPAGLAAATVYIVYIGKCLHFFQARKGR